MSWPATFFAPGSSPSRRTGGRGPCSARAKTGSSVSEGTVLKHANQREGLAIRATQVITIALAAVSVGLLFWFLRHTKTGKAMRAFADNEDLAGLSGISAQRFVTITWIVAATLAPLAGVLYGLDKSFRPFVYQQLVLPIFASAIVGGFGNPVGAIVGGFIVAFSEVALTYSFKRFFGYVLPTDWLPDGLYQLISTDYKYAVSFVILVVVLIVRPSGFLNRRYA